MGFYEDIVNILSTTPDDKTHGYFSTMPAEVARIGKQFMKDPIEITVELKIQVLQPFLNEFYL
jgi:ATP-dependent RNA helicase DeaD